MNNQDKTIYSTSYLDARMNGISDAHFDNAMRAVQQTASKAIATSDNLNSDLKTKAQIEYEDYCHVIDLLLTMKEGAQYGDN